MYTLSDFLNDELDVLSAFISENPDHPQNHVSVSVTHCSLLKVEQIGFEGVCPHA